MTDRTFAGEVIGKSYAAFKYLGTNVDKEGYRGPRETYRHREWGAGWKNWKACYRVLCGRWMLVELNGKGYKAVLQASDAAYGAETWDTTKRQEIRIEAKDIRVLMFPSL